MVGEVVVGGVEGKDVVVGVKVVKWFFFDGVDVEVGRVVVCG